MSNNDFSRSVLGRRRETNSEKFHSFTYSNRKTMKAEQQNFSFIAVVKHMLSLGLRHFYNHKLYSLSSNCESSREFRAETRQRQRRFLIKFMLEDFVHSCRWCYHRVSASILRTFFPFLNFKQKTKSPENAAKATVERGKEEKSRMPKQRRNNKNVQ